MDKLKDMVGGGGGGGSLDQQLQGINFPASKEDVCAQLEQRGVPGPIVDRIRNADTSQFDSVEEVKAKVGM